jgi:hydroxyacylglutathione hydrolase
MPSFRVELIPILDDNYVFCLIEDERKEALIVDPGDAGPVKEFLKKENLRLLGILVTHHHHDHIDGIHGLVSRHPCPVYAPLKNKEQISDVNHWVEDGDEFQLGPFSFSVLALPGHTLGHVAYTFSEQKWLFSGDVIFGLGCGRLFEGTPAQMFDSFHRVKMLPPQTQIFCTHEYTEQNLRFARTLQASSLYSGTAEDLDAYEKELKSKRSQNIPSVPLNLLTEVKTNPFMLTSSPDQFAQIRELRNKF